MHCWFEGHVQGVGFRYQTVQVAKGFEVAGTVENLSDGRVKLYAEGEASEVKAFREAVEAELGDYIRKTEVRSETGPRTCGHFRIIQ
ncbi:MAG: acylphosphatase [Verrucomicrobiota bacterium]